MDEVEVEVEDGDLFRRFYGPMEWGALLREWWWYEHRNHRAHKDYMTKKERERRRDEQGG